MIASRALGPWSFYKHALSIAAPVILQQFLLNAVSLIDNFMVAGLGDVAMAGVNIANQLTFVYLVVMGTIAGAGGIFLSQYKGAERADGMQQAYRFKLLFSSLATGIFFLLSMFMPEALLGLMTNGNPAQGVLVDQGANYLRTVAWSFLPLAFISSLGSSLRDIGQPKFPMIFSFVAAVVNTGLNWLFIGGNWGAPALGVQGAALATDAARLVELILLLVYVKGAKPAFRVPLRKTFAIDPVIIKNIFARSWMMLVSELTWVLSETVTAAVYNGRGGADLVAGMAAGWTIANLFFAVFGGIHVATGVLVGTSLGAGKLDEGRQRAVWIMRGSWFIGAFFALGQILSVALIPYVFPNLSAEAKSVTVTLITIIAAFLPLWVFINSQFAVARAGGDTWMGFIIDVAVTLLLFLPLMFTLSIITPWSAVVLFGLMKLTDILKAIIAWFWLKKERWVRNMTTQDDSGGPTT